MIAPVLNESLYFFRFMTHLPELIIAHCSVSTFSGEDQKSWIFVGSDDGAPANATFTSLLASCRMLEIEPWAYLRDVLCLLPRWPAHRMLELAPVNWADTLTLDDVRHVLDADPYRALILVRG